MLKAGYLVALENKFEINLSRCYQLSAFNNGFGVVFDFDVLKEFARKNFYIDKFEVLELLKEIQAKVSEKREEKGK